MEVFGGEATEGIWGPPIDGRAYAIVGNKMKMSSRMLESENCMLMECSEEKSWLDDRKLYKSM